MIVIVMMMMMMMNFRNLECRIILTSPGGVILEFDYIDVEQHEDCLNSCCDVINIYEG